MAFEMSKEFPTASLDITHFWDIYCRLIHTFKIVGVCAWRKWISHSFSSSSSGVMEGRQHSGSLPVNKVHNLKKKTSSKRWPVKKLAPLCRFACRAPQCVKVEVAVLGSPSLMVSVDVKQHWTCVNTPGSRFGVAVTKAAVLLLLVILLLIICTIVSYDWAGETSRVWFRFLLWWWWWWWWCRASCPGMSADILGTNCDQCLCMV